jgi:hypothetical protein
MKIIGISGRKQAGKNTLANYINGYILKQKGMINDFYIDDNGSLTISTEDLDGNAGYGILDVTRKDTAFVEYAEKELNEHYLTQLNDLNFVDLDSFNYKKNRV